MLSEFNGVGNIGTNVIPDDSNARKHNENGCFTPTGRNAIIHNNPVIFVSVINTLIISKHIVSFVECCPLSINNTIGYCGWDIARIILQNVTKKFDLLVVDLLI